MSQFHSYDCIALGSRNLRKVHEKNKKRVKYGDKYFESIRVAALAAKRSSTMVGNYAKSGGRELDGVFVCFVSEEEYQEKKDE